MLSADFDFKVVLVGIENEIEAKLAANTQYLIAQGFYYAKPMGADEADQFATVKQD
jgi:EAL domain-containing protein (putative c-di-GMP-specific phosphodiesterase class I)